MIYATMIAKVESEPVLYPEKDGKEEFLRFTALATSSNATGKYIYLKMSVMCYANLIPSIKKMGLKEGDYVYLNGMYFGEKRGAFYYHNLKLSNICKLKSLMRQEGQIVDGDKSWDQPFEFENIESSNLKSELTSNVATDKDLDF